MTAKVTHVLDTYSDEEFATALSGTLQKLLLKPNICTHDEPCAVLLGGQSGAGKTTLHKIIEP